MRDRGDSTDEAIGTKVHQHQNRSDPGPLPGGEREHSDIHVAEFNGTRHRRRLPLSHHSETAHRPPCARWCPRDPCPQQPQSSPFPLTARRRQSLEVCSEWDRQSIRFQILRFAHGFTIACEDILVKPATLPPNVAHQGPSERAKPAGEDPSACAC